MSCPTDKPKKRKRKKGKTKKTFSPSFSFQVNAKHLVDRPRLGNFVDFLKTSVPVLRAGLYDVVFVLVGVTAVSETLHASFAIDVDPVLARLGVEVLAPVLVETSAGTQAGSHGVKIEERRRDKLRYNVGKVVKRTSWYRAKWFNQDGEGHYPLAVKRF